MKPIIRSTSVLALGVCLAAIAHAQSKVEVWTGYNDEPRNGVSYSIGSGQPNPWIGSADTTFLGNASVASSYDPDEDAILLQNQGASTINLTAASIGAYDLFSLDGVTSPVALDPGAFVILAGIDGSDTFSSVQTVDLTIGGTGYAYTDAAPTPAPDGVLAGANPFIGGAETMPWTPIFVPQTTSGVPDTSSTMLLLGGAAAGLAAIRRRFSK
jgi:protein with PEP-CTERM/exosortase system signal